MRNISTYRSSRRNQAIRIDHGIWRAINKVAAYHRQDIVIKYVPTKAKGSAAARIYGKAYPQHRVPTLKYPTNGNREVSRRLNRTVSTI